MFSLVMFLCKWLYNSYNYLQIKIAKYGISFLIAIPEW